MMETEYQYPYLPEGMDGNGTYYTFGVYFDFVYSKDNKFLIAVEYMPSENDEDVSKDFLIEVAEIVKELDTPPEYSLDEWLARNEETIVEDSGTSIKEGNISLDNFIGEFKGVTRLKAGDWYYSGRLPKDNTNTGSLTIEKNENGYVIKNIILDKEETSTITKIEEIIIDFDAEFTYVSESENGYNWEWLTIYSEQGDKLMFAKRKEYGRMLIAIKPRGESEDYFYDFIRDYYFE